MDALVATECKERRPSSNQLFTGQAMGETGSEVDWITPPKINVKWFELNKSLN